MAVTMVIGNSIKGSLSIFSPGVSIASLIANSFPEANSLQLSALMYAAGTLMILSLVVNVFAVRIVGKSR
jgi:phosphate transport system permease protein